MKISTFMIFRDLLETVVCGGTYFMGVQIKEPPEQISACSENRTNLSSIHIKGAIVQVSLKIFGRKGNMHIISASFAFIRSKEKAAQ